MTDDEMIDLMLAQSKDKQYPNFYINKKITMGQLERLCERLAKHETQFALTLISNDLGDEGAMKIASILGDGKSLITELTFALNKMTDAGATHLANAFSNSNLVGLNLSLNKITEIGAGSIASMLKDNKNFCNLDLSHNPIGDDGVIEILKEGGNLKSLKLIKCQITSSGLEYFAYVISRNENLSYVNFSYNEIDNGAIMLLCGALTSNNSLKTLELESCSLKKYDGELIAGMLRFNKGLTFLNLKMNQIGSAVVAIGDALKSNNTLKSLILRANAIKIQDLLAFAKCLDVNKSLSTLDIRWNKLDYDGPDKFRRLIANNRTLTDIFFEPNLSLTKNERAVVLAGDLFENPQSRELTLSLGLLMRDEELVKALEEQFTAQEIALIKSKVAEGWERRIMRKSGEEFLHLL